MTFSLFFIVFSELFLCSKVVQKISSNSAFYKENKKQATPLFWLLFSENALFEFELRKIYFREQFCNAKINIYRNKLVFTTLLISYITHTRKPCSTSLSRPSRDFDLSSLFYSSFHISQSHPLCVSGSLLAACLFRALASQYFITLRNST